MPGDAPVFEVCDETPVPPLETELAFVLAVSEPPDVAAGDPWAPLRRGLHDFFVAETSSPLRVSLHRVSTEATACESTLLTLAGDTDLPLGTAWLDAVVFGALPAGPLASPDPLSLLSAVAHAEPGKRTASVLIADAPRPDCIMDTTGAEALVEAAARTGHRTFVLSPAESASKWDALAAAGGSAAAYPVALDDATGVTDALRQVRDDASGCGYDVPASALGRDPALLAVKVQQPDGQTFYLDRLPAGATCQGQQAYRFDNPAAPTRIELCPALCTELPAGAEVIIVSGCAPETPPMP